MLEVPLPQTLRAAPARFLLRLTRQAPLRFSFRRVWQGASIRSSPERRADAPGQESLSPRGCRVHVIPTSLAGCFDSEFSGTTGRSTGSIPFAAGLPRPCHSDESGRVLRFGVLRNDGPKHRVRNPFRRGAAASMSFRRVWQGSSIRSSPERRAEVPGQSLSLRGCRVHVIPTSLRGGISSAVSGAPGEGFLAAIVMP
jgi:hypothetical protein